MNGGKTNLAHLHFFLYCICLLILISNTPKGVYSNYCTCLRSIFLNMLEIIKTFWTYTLTWAQYICVCTCVCAWGLFYLQTSPNNSLFVGARGWGCDPKKQKQVIVRVIRPCCVGKSEQIHAMNACNANLQSHLKAFLFISLFLSNTWMRNWLCLKKLLYKYIQSPN